MNKHVAFTNSAQAQWKLFFNKGQGLIFSNFRTKVVDAKQHGEDELRKMIERVDVKMVTSGAFFVYGKEIFTTITP